MVLKAIRKPEATECGLVNITEPAALKRTPLLVPG